MAFGFQATGGSPATKTIRRMAKCLFLLVWSGWSPEWVGQTTGHSWPRPGLGRPRLKKLLPGHQALWGSLKANAIYLVFDCVYVEILDSLGWVRDDVQYNMLFLTLLALS
jgi:hypothetical protein